MDEMTVALAERSYRIHFGSDILGQIGHVCRELKLGNTVAVVTNPTVGALYYDAVQASLAGAGFTVHRIDMPDGEQHKNGDTLHAIYGRLIDAGLDRGSFLVSLGGGVVGDIAGFAAATYLRGIPFIQVPTTLLAQVDSSVGGKTGINHEKGKNLIGAFYQPVAVLVDAAVLDSLPEREYLGGLAEVVKYGVTLDRDLFCYIHDHVEDLLARDRASVLHVVKRSCFLKASIVTQDERETGLRAVLNYGHTFGHAVETITGYKEYIHGEAVAMGMVQAARLSEEAGLSSSADTDAIEKVLYRLGLPTKLPSFGKDDFKEVMLRDKKVRDGGLSFVYNKGIGDFCIDKVRNIEALLKNCVTGD